MPFINKTPNIPLVAHNGYMFDMPVIKDCCEYFGMDTPNLKYFDSLIIAKKTLPELDSHRLTALGEYFNIDYLAHDALEDSRTCGQIIKFAADKWGVNSIEELLKSCKTELRSF